MGRTSYRTISKFIQHAERYAHVGNIGEPINIELEQALLIDMICRRYGCMPSDVLEEDASLLRIIKLATIVEQKNNG
tara:strand:- start:4074 stop:4304 length:231 start_codon:yes stop_codon:yes gene_type:complete